MAKPGATAGPIKSLVDFGSLGANSLNVYIRMKLTNHRLLANSATARSAAAHESLYHSRTQLAASLADRHCRTSPTLSRLACTVEKSSESRGGIADGPCRLRHGAHPAEPVERRGQSPSPARVVSKAKLALASARSCTLASMMRPASMAALSGEKTERPWAIMSAFTKSETFSTSRRISGAAVVFPAPLGPASTMTLGRTDWPSSRGVETKRLPYRRPLRLPIVRRARLSRVAARRGD